MRMEHKKQNSAADEPGWAAPSRPIRVALKTIIRCFHFSDLRAPYFHRLLWAAGSRPIPVHRRLISSFPYGIAAAIFCAIATIVRVGLTASGPGITDASAMKRFSWTVAAPATVLNTLPSVLTT